MQLKILKFLFYQLIQHNRHCLHLKTFLSNHDNYRFQLLIGKHFY
jgi:hypothetical protein